MKTAPFKTKTDKAKELYIYGDRVGAMKIFKTFKVGFTKEERRIMQIAYECQTGHEQFYQNIGIDTTDMWSRAKELIKNRYGI